ncbi:DHA2 family efflux MFS transporter permease subunit [Aestuariivirga litoralis]|uniref:DHA2 family efflux MFS transporter permease subunit n=1 Tax=Aestuariivirga litoralis TaxID=2650924 RepID=UPI0018C72F8D|nr:DHA2 family efflux MFS transporter permease subunit [Aestuariivirga litoralis]MBG1231927.1 multidrug efflux MFS transporter [Aestuariivirga litoralis]
MVNDSERLHLAAFPRWLGFAALCTGMAMAILDIQVVVTSLPVIEQALNIGADQMSWVQTSYLIAEVIAIPLTGLLTRVFGLKRLLLAALLAFTLASIACAFSSNFIELLVARSIQGAAGGVLIPIVFSAIFFLFPPGIQQSVATTLAAFLAVLAPTLGPLIGGWLTDHYSWHWLFLINIPPGILAMFAGLWALPFVAKRMELFKGLDWLSLVLLAVGLAALLIGLKYAPKDGWLHPLVLFWFALSLGSLFWLWRRPNPAIMFHLLEDRSLFFGCVLSFIIGFALYANIYVIPVFMSFVRGHTPLEIGITTLVMGLSQLFFAPFAVQIDRWFNARWLAAIGFTAFGIGLFMNAHLNVNSDYDAFFWPQVLRGIASTMCVLPPIRMAMALLPLDKVSEGSGLFNVSRNIGGALGIAVVDTLIFSRTPIHADQILDWVKTAPDKAAAAMQIPVTDVPAPDDAMAFMGISDLVQSAALTFSINESWILLGIVSLVALPVILWMGPVKSALPVRKLNQNPEV